MHIFDDNYQELGSHIEFVETQDNLFIVSRFKNRKVNFQCTLQQLYVYKWSWGRNQLNEMAR